MADVKYLQRMEMTTGVRVPGAALAPALGAWHLLPTPLATEPQWGVGYPANFSTTWVVESQTLCAFPWPKACAMTRALPASALLPPPTYRIDKLLE